MTVNDIVDSYNIQAFHFHSYIIVNYILMFLFIFYCLGFFVAHTDILMITYSQHHLNFIYLFI